MGKTIRINGIDVPVISDEMTGAEIKKTAGIPADRVLVQQDTDQNTIVPDARRVRVADGAVFAHHARHSKATHAVDATPATSTVADTTADETTAIAGTCPHERAVSDALGRTTRLRPAGGGR